jgi:hypothetical protein
MFLKTWIFPKRNTEPILEDQIIEGIKAFTKARFSKKTINCNKFKKSFLSLKLKFKEKRLHCHKNLIKISATSVI